MKSLRAAIGFLTILPVPSRDDPAGLASARAYFPLVGLILGALLAGLDLLLLYSRHLFMPEGESGLYISFAPAFPLLTGAILVVALAALTRGLHLDGLMDSCDALFGGFTRERRLEILRDPHVGAFAVIGVVSLLLIKLTAIASLYPPNRLFALILFPCLSRWAMLLAMELYPYARSEGLGSAFLRDRGRRRLWFGLGCALLVSLVFGGVTGIILLAAVSLLAWAIGAWASRLLGGLTGDIYGAVNEIAEAAVLVLIVFITAGSPFSLQPLFYN